MAAPLKLNVKSLEFDEYRHDNSGPKQKTQPEKSKSLFGKFSSSKSQPIAKELSDFISIPLTYNQDDYLNLLIVQDFLQPDSTMSVEEAIGRIIEVHASYDCNPLYYAIGPFCATIAAQIPYSHPSQLKLARLVWLLGRSPERLKKLTPKEGTDTDDFYQDLKKDLEDDEGDLGSDPGADPMSYVNYQAFLAHVLALHVWDPTPDPALWAMNRAFGSKEPKMCDFFIMGAAQWLLWNGQGLFQMILQYDSVPSVTSVDEKKTPESQQLTVELWNSWKVGFSEAVGNEEVGEEARDLAKRALEIMQVLEKTMRF